MSSMCGATLLSRDRTLLALLPPSSESTWKKKYVELVAPPVDGTDTTMDRTESSSDGDWETANGDVCAS